MPSNALDEALEAAVRAGRAPGIVARVGGPGGCAYRAARGAIRAGSDRPVPEDAVFRIASMTKLVTSVAVMQLVEDGRLELDAPLARYLRGFRQPEVLVSFDPVTGRYATRPAAREATLRELLSHTGGYGYWFLDAPLRLASGEPPDLMNPPFLMHEPGRRFAYSTSTDVIGQVVQPVTGLALDDYFARRIFEPLGMPDTGFGLPSDPSRLVPVHRRRGADFFAAPNETTGQPVRGGGGLYSTADDYLRLLRCLMRGGELDGRHVLRPQSVAEITRNQIGGLRTGVPRTALPERTNDFIFMDGTEAFGFGVMVDTHDAATGRAAGSYGWGGIVNTYFWVDPRAELAALLWMQVAPFADPDCVTALRDFEAAVYREFA